MTSFTMATTLEAALLAEGEMRAGGTDVQERRRSGVSVSRGAIIDISRLPGLNMIEREPNGATSIGAPSYEPPSAQIKPFGKPIRVSPCQPKHSPHRKYVTWAQWAACCCNRHVAGITATLPLPVTKKAAIAAPHVTATTNLAFVSTWDPASTRIPPQLAWHYWPMGQK